MKRLKFFYLILFVGLFLMSLNSCKECDGENPRARVVNNGTKEVSVQIKTSGGSTENLNNIVSGSSSDFQSYAPGLITFTITVGKSDYVKNVEMSTCCEYDIIIDANNNIKANSIDRND